MPNPRAIDCWVNVKVVSRQRAEEYYVRTAEDYFKRGEEFFADGPHG